MAEIPTPDHVTRCLGPDDRNDSDQSPPAKRTRYRKRELEKARKSKRSSSVAHTSKINNILDFPSEVILKILSYLNQKERLINASLICKRFRDLAMDKTLWTTLTLPERPCNKTVNDIVCNLFENFTLLKHLNLNKRTGNVNVATSALRQCPRLESLMIDISPRERKRLGNLLDIIKDSDSMNSLELRGTLVISKLVEKASCLKSLTSFIITPLNVEKDEGLLKALTSHCVKLRRFETDSQADAESLDFFLNNAPDGIEHLKVECRYLASDKFKLLRRFRCLHTLNLDSAEHLNGSGLDSITRMTSLKSLSLTSCSNLTDEMIATSFHKMDNLSSLSLIACDKFGDAGLTAMVDNCPGLKRLVIAFRSNVTSVGVRWVLEHCRVLEKLALYLFELDLPSETFENAIAPLQVFKCISAYDEDAIKRYVPSLKRVYSVR